VKSIVKEVVKGIDVVAGIVEGVICEGHLVDDVVVKW